MPYITCPDGKTYSRHDQSYYVEWCICNENEQADKKFNECMEDPTCKKEYLDKQDVIDSYIMYGGGFMVVLLVLYFITILRIK